jgi:sporulation protein YlmC with PRC-barrel domain
MLIFPGQLALLATEAFTMQLLGTAFNDCTLRAVDGPVGEIADLLFEEKSWSLRWLVVQCGDFLHGRRVLVRPAALEPPDEQSWTLALTLTTEQIKNSPAIGGEGPISLEMDRSAACYYGCAPLDGQGCPQANRPLFPQTSLTRVAAARNRQDKPEPHVRSIAELEGYAVHAADGEAGFLKNVVIDVATWTISSLVIDMPKWWYGKHVVVPSAAAGQISWCHRCIRLDLPLDKVESSPRLHPPGPADTAIQALLRACGGWRAEAPGPSSRIRH